MKSKATSSKTRSDSSVPLDRALRTVIDPSRYGATHTIFSTDATPTDVVMSGEEQKRQKKVGDNVLEIEELPKRHIHTNPAPVIATAPGPETKSSTVVPTTMEVDVEMGSSELELHQTTAETARPTAKRPISPTQQVDALSAQLQQEKSKTIALMHSVLKRGWEVDIDSNSDEDKGKERKKIVRMASVSDNEEGRRGEPESEGDEQLNMVETHNPSFQTHGVSARAGKAERSGSSPSKPVGEIRAEKRDQSEKDRTETATPAPGLTTAPSTEAVKSKSLKDLFKPHEEDGNYFCSLPYRRTDYSYAWSSLVLASREPGLKRCTFQLGTRRYSNLRACSIYFSGNGFRPTPAFYFCSCWCWRSDVRSKDPPILWCPTICASGRCKEERHENKRYVRCRGRARVA